MAQRLLLALIYTFGSSFPGLQSLVLTFLCATFTLLHCLVAPLKNDRAQLLQAMLLFCLTVVALCGTPFAQVGWLL
jgi:hypothetical protein